MSLVQRRGPKMTELDESKDDLIIPKKLIIEMIEVLKFYASPETYFAIGFLPDPPCGEFINDFSETHILGYKPGKSAREVLDKLVKLAEEEDNDKQITGAISRTEGSGTS